MKFAEQLVKALEKQGVKRIYGLVGDSLNPIVDAVRESSIQWIHVRNEEVAAFAAGADSLVSGELAVCAASCGPGNTHFIQGLYNAHRDGAKVLALASHIPSAQIGGQFFQETHPEQIFKECSGYCEMVNSPEQGATITHHAIQSTMAGNGVSVLVIPGDITQMDAVDGTPLDSVIATRKPVVFPHPEEAAALAHAINQADKVALFCGVGCKNAYDEVVALAEKIKAPVGHAFGGKMYIQNNPYDVGMSGLLGYGACHDAMFEADLVILLGTDFPYNAFLPRENVAQVDIDGSHIGRRTTVKYPVVGDVAATIHNILPSVDEKTDRSWLDKMLKLHAKKLTKIVDAYTKDVENHFPIHPEYVASIVDELAADDALFTVDTGMCNVWGARYITPNGKRDMIGSFRHGTMANAMPMALGAQVAQPDRQVVSISGDGGLSMLLGDLITAKTYNLPVKVITFNNSSLGMVKLEMLVDGLPTFGTDNGLVDFGKIAEGMGIKSITIEDPKDVRAKLAEAFAYNEGPVLVDIRTDADALSIPPQITWEQMMGFSTAAARTVLDGGVGKMVDLAKSNLRNIPSPSTIGKIDQIFGD